MLAENEWAGEGKKNECNVCGADQAFAAPSGVIGDGGWWRRSRCVLTADVMVWKGK